MNIEKVAIMGAGAVGSYFITGLIPKLGDQLMVVAEGERKERLTRDGIVVNHENWKLNVKTPEEARGADLLLIATKYGALKESLPAVEKIVDDNTIVMSLLNGVDSEEIIGERIGKQHMVYSMMKIASERAGNSIVYDPSVTQGVFFGEADRKRSERVGAIAVLFEGTDIRYTHL